MKNLELENIFNEWKLEETKYQCFKVKQLHKNTILSGFQLIIFYSMIEFLCKKKFKRNLYFNEKIKIFMKICVIFLKTCEFIKQTLTEK
mgnify:CR=1 FL=1|tara:strand:+ start:467 stop:733 length:267 start_codon:yes stop_codon:yes gene_type:complete